MRRCTEFRSLLSTLPLVALLGGGIDPALPSAAAGKAGGVLICHHAGPTKQVEISVSPAAVPSHIINHGDTIGACGGFPT